MNKYNAIDKHEDNEWIGVDLDGTLAHYDKWVSHTHIGDPIIPMINRVKEWINQGKNVKILTARAYPTNISDESIQHIKKWCKKHIGQELDVTCMKDYNMVELWDDRAVQVIKNTGLPIY